MRANLNLDAIAALTPGFTGADLANLVNEAALAATRRGAAEVDLPDFSAAIERIVAGLERKNRLLNDTERRIVAHHEMGHALVAAARAGHRRRPQGVDHPARDRRAGLHDPAAHRRSLPDDAHRARGEDAVLLGGRAAEQIVFGHLSTRGADDLAKATSIARAW